jgi:hypothetical protein
MSPLPPLSRQHTAWPPAPWGGTGGGVPLSVLEQPAAGPAVGITKRMYGQPFKKFYVMVPQQRPICSTERMYEQPLSV